MRNCGRFVLLIDGARTRPLEQPSHANKRVKIQLGVACAEHRARVAKRYTDDVAILWEPT